MGTNTRAVRDQTTGVPSNASLTPRAAINWIAFQIAEDRDLSLRDDLTRELGVEDRRKAHPVGVDGAEYPFWPFSSSILGLAIGELVLKSFSSELRELRTAAEDFPDELASARASVVQSISRGNSAAVLYQKLKDCQATSSHRSLVRLDSERQLLWALSENMLSIAAIPKVPAAATPMVVPSWLFSTTNAGFGADGSIKSLGSVIYTKAVLSRSDVMAIWPASRVKDYLQNELTEPPDEKERGEERAINPNRRGPKTEGSEEMMRAFIVLTQGREGKPFASKKAAHGAVLAKIGHRGPARGYGYDTFCKVLRSVKRPGEVDN